MLNRPKLLWLKVMVVSVREKLEKKIQQVSYRETNASEPLMKRRYLSSSLEATCKLTRRHPALRWREPMTGFGTELGNLSS